MRLVFSLVLLAGLALAGVAVFMARDYVGAYQAELRKRDAALAQVVRTTEVLVATRALRYGERLLEADLRAVRWPADAVPEGAFTELAAILPEGDAVPRTVLHAMDKDEVVLPLKVTEPGEDAGVSARLGRGMGAFAVRVDVASGVSGFLRPGDRVDVYWSGPIPSGEGATREVTRLIDTGVGVLAIDQMANGDMAEATVARTVTVEASPLQVAALAQAQKHRAPVALARRQRRRQRGRRGAGRPAEPARPRGAPRGRDRGAAGLHDPYPAGRRLDQGADPLPVQLTATPVARYPHERVARSA